MFKRMKRLLRLRNKSGFTMVEIIVALALLGILVLGIMGFVTPVLSSVRVKEQNARATLLSEAIDTYIANSIQYAYYVAVFDYVASGDTAVPATAAIGTAPAVKSAKYNGVKYDDTVFTNLVGTAGLAELMNHPILKDSNYEIRCIGLRWTGVPGENIKKLMLTNEKVDQSTGALDENGYVTVFGSVFYDGLYPIIKFENYCYRLNNPNYDNTKPESDDNPKYLDDIDEKNVNVAPGLKVVTEVYLSPDCYNVNENARERVLKSFTGTSFADLPNIRNPIINSSNTYKICPTISMYTKSENGETVPSYSGAYDADSGKNRTYTDVNGETYYYPNSFIYYIARKVKTQGF